MKKYEELPDFNTEEVQNLLESLFARYVKNKSDISEWFEINPLEIRVLLRNLPFTRDYCKTFGYEFQFIVLNYSAKIKFVRCK